MASLLGQPVWMVTTTATALAGFPDTAYGASPFIFPASAFSSDGTALYQTPTDFGETNGDVPTSQLDFAWTNYGTGNLSPTDVDAIIKGNTTINKTLAFGEYIGQHNNGNHSTLYGDVDTYLERPRRPSGDRRRQRQLRRLGDVPRHQRERRLGEARPRLLPQLVRERPPVDHGVLGERLPALPRLVHPQADELTVARSRAHAAPASEPRSSGGKDPHASTGGGWSHARVLG